MLNNFIIFLELFVIIGLLFVEIEEWKTKAKTLLSKFKEWLKTRNGYVLIFGDSHLEDGSAFAILAKNKEEEFEIRKTSKEWYDLIPKGWEFDLVDKRGWDSPLIECFYQWTITKKEFIERAKASHYTFNHAMNTDDFENGNW